MFVLSSSLPGYEHRLSNPTLIRSETIIGSEALNSVAGGTGGKADTVTTNSAQSSTNISSGAPSTSIARSGHPGGTDRRQTGTSAPSLTKRASDGKSIVDSAYRPMFTNEPTPSFYCARVSGEGACAGGGTSVIGGRALYETVPRHDSINERNGNKKGEIENY